ncbi:MAG TPA: TetR/AcrR family transcriptional regulator [Bacillota bacterium]|nr:TetR/AcrR family transcriptional regulator [Bacillota bacterium]
MNGFERRKKAKMESILQAAFELFCSRGIKAVSIAEIARKAQVSQVSIYNFFGNKENLVRESVFSYMNLKIKEYELLFDSNRSFMEKFQKLVFEKMEANEHYSEEIVQFILWEDPLVQQLVREYYQTHSIPLMLKLIEQGKIEGYVDRAITNESILIYMEMFWDVLTKKSLSTQARKDLGKLFFYGLLGQPLPEKQ